MLVLTREQNETITITHPDGLITIKVLDANYRGYGRVKIGVEAPKTSTILRGEVPNLAE